MSNVTLLPDHMLGEVIARTHDHDLLAFLSSCKTFQRVLALDTAREVKSPPNTHVVTSLALLDWALGSGWAWPTKIKRGEEDFFAACSLAAEGGVHCRPATRSRRRLRMERGGVRRRLDERPPKDAKVAPRKRMPVGPDDVLRCGGERSARVPEVGPHQ